MVQKTLEQLKAVDAYLNTKATTAKGARADFYSKLIDANLKRIEGLAGSKSKAVADGKTRAGGGFQKKKPVEDESEDDMGFSTGGFD